MTETKKQVTVELSFTRYGKESKTFTYENSKRVQIHGDIGQRTIRVDQYDKTTTLYENHNFRLVCMRQTRV